MQDCVLSRSSVLGRPWRILGSGCQRCAHILHNCRTARRDRNATLDHLRNSPCSPSTSKHIARPSPCSTAARWRPLLGNTCSIRPWPVGPPSFGSTTRGCARPWHLFWLYHQRCVSTNRVEGVWRGSRLRDAGLTVDLLSGGHALWQSCSSLGHAAYDLMWMWLCSESGS